jgi:3-hydroxyisobutyrate dehydrogenase-like beta-hydroxyacid dehydrogenase
MTTGKKERVGIVGVGRMGLAMLKHLVRHGYQVTACDIDDKQLAKASGAGAATVKTPAEVARAADLVIVGVGYDDEVNQVVLGTDGLLANLASGSIIAVSSTAKPDTVKALDERARAVGVAILDAPICRGRFAADDGTLLALVGGKPDVVERGRAVYGCFCSDYAHLGEVGHGQVGKTMNNLLLWINAVGLIEAGRLAETTGIDLLHLGAQGHADRRRSRRQGRPVAADHRRDQGIGQGRAPHQGDERAEVDGNRGSAIRGSIIKSQ